MNFKSLFRSNPASVLEIINPIQTRASSVASDNKNGSKKKERNN